jgi:hypothetical protein
MRGQRRARSLLLVLAVVLLGVPTVASSGAAAGRSERQQGRREKVRRSIQRLRSTAGRGRLATFRQARASGFVR